MRALYMVDAPGARFEFSAPPVTEQGSVCIPAVKLTRIAGPFEIAGARRTTGHNSQAAAHSPAGAH